MKLQSFALWVVLSVALVVGWPIATQGQAPLNRQISHRLSEAQLLQLFFSSHINNTGETVERSELFLNQLPPGLPAELPRPPQSEIVFSQAEAENGYTILMQVGRSLQEVEQFYAAQFRQNGWQDQSEAARNFSMLSLGFETPPDATLMFQNPQQTASVILSLQTQSEGSSFVWLHLFSLNVNAEPADLISGSVLPRIYAEIEGLFSSGGNKVRTSELADVATSFRAVSTIRRLETQQTLEQLRRLYGTQLQQRGWTQVTEQSQPSYLRTAWQKRLENNSVLGINFHLFSLDRYPGQYYAYLKVVSSSAMTQTAGNSNTVLFVPRLVSEGNPLPQLRLAAQRLLEALDATLQVGQVPTNFPFVVPVPPNAEIVGSINSSRGRSSVVLNVRQTPDQVYAFYSERMRSLGFRQLKPEEEIYAGVNLLAFIPSAPSAIMPGVFCDDARDITAFVQASPVQSGVTAVELRLDPAPDADTVCKAAPPQFPEVIQQLSQMPIPELLPPPDAIVQLPNIGVGYFRPEEQSLDHSMTATIRTTKGVAELTSHYVAQMQQENWKLEDSANTPSLGATVWSLEDARKVNWKAFLILVKDATTVNGYDAMLHIQQQ